MSTDNTDGRSFIFDFLSAAVCVWPKSLISIVRFYLVCTSCSERTQQGNIVLKNIFVFGICFFVLFCFLLVSSISACCTSFVCTCLLFLVLFFFLIYGLRWVSSWNNLISGSYLLFLHFWSSFSLYCLFDDGQAFVELLLQLPSNWFKKINLLLKRVPTSHMRCDVPAWREWRTYLVLFFLSV